MARDTDEPSVATAHGEGFITFVTWHSEEYFARECDLLSTACDYSVVVCSFGSVLQPPSSGGQIGTGAGPSTGRALGRVLQPLSSGGQIGAGAGPSTGSAFGRVLQPPSSGGQIGTGAGPSTRVAGIPFCSDDPVEQNETVEQAATNSAATESMRNNFT